VLSVSRIRDAQLVERLAAALRRNAAVGSVTPNRLAVQGEANELSDWDFKVETGDFTSVAGALPELVAPLEPLAEQWDRLAITRATC
jgi:hypothetical protein